MKVTAIAPWFGSNRILAAKVGEKLASAKWVGIPFAGGMCELGHIKSKIIVANDIHSHIINLARVVSDPKLCSRLVRKLRRTTFHSQLLSESQAICNAVRVIGFDKIDQELLFGYAYHYFICVWMSRSGTAGTKGEFGSGLSIRWKAGGGDSVVRFRSATESLREWQRIVRNITFICMDAFAFIRKCEDLPKHGIYVDPPFPGAGDAYQYTINLQQQADLAVLLSSYKHCRVVCRFYRHELIDALYPTSHWDYFELKGRKQTNKEAPELLLTNRVSW